MTPEEAMKEEEYREAAVEATMKEFEQFREDGNWTAYMKVYKKAYEKIVAEAKTGIKKMKF